MFDVDKEGDLFIMELNDFKTKVTSLSECSPGAIVFVLIHKFDKIKESERKIVFEVLSHFIFLAKIQRDYSKSRWLKYRN